MKQTFSAQVEAQLQMAERLMDAVFREAVKETVEQALEPGPSMATAKKTIKQGLGARGRGEKRKELFGPIANPGGAGNLPIDTGYLRASFMLSEGKPLFRTLPAREEGREYELEPYEFVINNARGDLPIYATFGASYAAAVEFGFNGQTPRAFVRKAAQRWQSNVDRAVSKVKGAMRG